MGKRSCPRKRSGSALGHTQHAPEGVRECSCLGAHKGSSCRTQVRHMTSAESCECSAQYFMPSSTSGKPCRASVFTAAWKRSPGAPAALLRFKQASKKLSRNFMPVRFALQLRKCSCARALTRGSCGCATPGMRTLQRRTQSRVLARSSAPSMRPSLFFGKKMTLYGDLPPPIRAHAATARRLAVQGKAALSPNLARPFIKPPGGP